MHDNITSVAVYMIREYYLVFIILLFSTVGLLVRFTQRNNQNVFTILRLIWDQTEFCLDQNQSGNGTYNSNFDWFDEVQKIFICVYSEF